MRGPLGPASLPISRTRAEEFDELVLDAVEHLEGRWSQELRTVEFAVEDVPPPDDPEGDGEQVESAGVPLSRLFRSAGRSPARIVLYRRPIELRSGDAAELADLLHDLVVEQVSRLLGLDPDTVDPGAGSED